MKVDKYICDLLIIGGGAAGCFAAIKAGESKILNTIVVDKGHIKRSGCLASGINAINAYLDEEDNPLDYATYVEKEFKGIVRRDLLLSIGNKLNKVTKDIESYGLTILKDKDGKYIKRAKRSIKINGENIKPILAEKVREFKNIKVLNYINIVDYIKREDEIIGAIGIDLKKNSVVLIYSKKTICSTGGAAGIYSSYNKGIKKHKMWYSPFNIGAGYAMGIRAGAEMTSFEMRFIALRVKESIAPTGTVAQGLKASQINSYGRRYMESYRDKSTAMRLYGTVKEEREGRGPCFLKTEGISKSIKEDLRKAYLNMAPTEVLRWQVRGIDLSKNNLEISGTEPYIVGGHSSSGYWIKENRETTLKNLYAIGDVAGGSPKKYVTGAFAEADIAIKEIINVLNKNKNIYIDDENSLINKFLNPLFRVNRCELTIFNLEEKLKNIMDNYAGGQCKFYEYSEEELKMGKEKVIKLKETLDKIAVKSMEELSDFYDVYQKIYVARILIEHLLARKERRIRIYEENISYPNISKEYELFINSLYKEGKVEIIKRPLEVSYEH